MTVPAAGGLAGDTVVGWVTLTQASELWPDADVLSDDVLAVWLLSAYEECHAFAPALADGAPVPESWRVAQVMQARAAYRALKAGGGDQVGPDGFAVTVYPLDWQVRQKLRPKTGRPRVG